MRLGENAGPLVIRRANGETKCHRTGVAGQRCMKTYSARGLRSEVLADVQKAIHLSSVASGLLPVNFLSVVNPLCHFL